MAATPADAARLLVETIRRVRERHGAAFREQLDERIAVRDLRLLPAALSAWGIAFALGAAPAIRETAGWASGIGAVVSCGALLAHTARLSPPTRSVGAMVRIILPHLTWCFAIVFLITASAGWHERLAAAEPLGQLAASGTRIPVIATVTGPVPASAILASDAPEEPAGGSDPWRGRERPRPIRIRIEQIGERGGQSTPSRIEAIYFGRVRGDAASITIGTRISLEGRVRLPAPGRNPLVFGTRPAIVLAAPGALESWADSLRSGFADAARALPAPGGQLVPGLAVGDTRAVDTRLEHAMRICSLLHLMAVSGANCALVIGGALLLGRVLRVPRLIRLAAAGVALAGFVLLVTPEGSVIRAGAMAAIVLLSEAAGRRASGVPLLLLAVIGLVAHDPGIVNDIGFTLSVLATAGLLVCAPPLTVKLARWMPTPLAAAIALPLTAQLACQPVLLTLQAGVPLYGVLANLLAGCAAPVATALGLISCLLEPIAPWAARPLLLGAWLAAQWIGTVALGVASWPAATLPWWPGTPGVLALALLVLAACLLLFARRRIRLPILLVLCIVIAAGAGGAIGAGVHRAIGFPAAWRMAACDVGQGDATIVRAAGSVALIDTGEEATALESCIDELQIGAIDLLLLSHFDRDHSGAAFEIAPRIGALIVPDTREARAERALDRFRAAGIPVHFAAAGDAWPLGDTVWTALWPPRERGGPSQASGNDGSLVVRVDPAAGCTRLCRSLIALGDLSASPQTAMRLHFPQLLGADIVKVSHHGSRDQDPELYRQIGARLGIVSSGAGNPYGHPAPEALAALARAGTFAARTDQLGTIVVHETAAELAIWTTVRGPRSAAHPLGTLPVSGQPGQRGSSELMPPAPGQAVQDPLSIPATGRANTVCTLGHEAREKAQRKWAGASFRGRTQRILRSSGNAWPSVTPTPSRWVRSWGTGRKGRSRFSWAALGYTMRQLWRHRAAQPRAAAKRPSRSSGTARSAHRPSCSSPEPRSTSPRQRSALCVRRSGWRIRPPR